MKFLLLAAVIVAIGKTQTVAPVNMQLILYYMSLLYDMIDTNNDDNLSNRERVAAFVFYDQNSDNCIDFEEYTGPMEYPPEYEDLMRANFYFADSLSATSEADGCITRQENEELYDLMDLNADGEVTLEEFDTASLSIGQAIWDSLQSLGLYTTHRP